MLIQNVLLIFVAMENLVIKRTLKTPGINFDYNSGELLIEGISIPENTIEFYKEVMAWLEEYRLKAQPKSVLKLKLEYFNTSTSVVLLNIFKLFSQIEHSDLMVKWYYEEDDIEMLEVGEDYLNIIKVPFELVSVESF